MARIVSIFETEFPVIEKVDTKDWVNFLMQVKQEVELVVQ